MKKASDYISGEILERIGDYSNDILEAIRLAQEDAIKETVKECNNDVEIIYNNGEVTTAILSVADKLIQQL